MTWRMIKMAAMGRRDLRIKKDDNEMDEQEEVDEDVEYSFIHSY